MGQGFTVDEKMVKMQGDQNLLFGLLPVLFLNLVKCWEMLRFNKTIFETFRTQIFNWLWLFCLLPYENILIVMYLHSVACNGCPMYIYFLSDPCKVRVFSENSVLNISLSKWLIIFLIFLKMPMLIRSLWPDFITYWYLFYYGHLK